VEWKTVNGLSFAFLKSYEQAVGKNMVMLFPAKPRESVLEQD
jgi:hypothetical protein